MGNVVNEGGWTQQSAGSLVATGTGRSKREWIDDVALSAKYEAGGDALSLPDGRVEAVIVMPESDGETTVAWNGDTEDPRLRVFTGGSEVKKGSDQSKVRRRVLLIVSV